MSILLLSNDLGFSSRITGGPTPVKLASNTESLLELATAEAPALVVLDLTTNGLDVESLVPQLRSLSPPPGSIFAVGPHVHEAKLAAAAAAGCDMVFSRGQFSAHADKILARFAEQ